MRKIAIIMTLIISVLFAFSSCAHLGGDHWVGAWAGASKSEADAFKQAGIAAYSGMSEAQWDAYIDGVEKSTGVSGLPRGNPNEWNDAQWAKFFNATAVANEAAGRGTSGSWVFAGAPSVSGSGTSGAGAAGTGAAGTGTGTAGTGTAGTGTGAATGTASSAPSMYTAGSAEYNSWNIYNRYSNNLILAGAQYYTVVSGDMMRTISQRFYGNQQYYPVILLASRDVVVDPEKIIPGMLLTIPDLQTNLNNPSSKQAIKDVYKEIADLRRSEGHVDVANSLIEFANGL